MSWRDSTRLKGRADKVRFIGWVNLAVTFVLSAAAADASSLIVGAVWAAAVMALVYGMAHLIDKRAERVVGR